AAPLPPAAESRRRGRLVPSPPGRRSDDDRDGDASPARAPSAPPLRPPPAPRPPAPDRPAPPPPAPRRPPPRPPGGPPALRRRPRRRAAGRRPGERRARRDGGARACRRHHPLPAAVAAHAPRRHGGAGAELPAAVARHVAPVRRDRPRRPPRTRLPQGRYP